LELACCDLYFGKVSTLQAPEENYFSVHVRIVGDWTADLSKALGADGEGSEVILIIS